MQTVLDNVVQILSAGAIGLGFLLAYLAYRLLAQEQKNTPPQDSIIREIRAFMVFSIVLVVLGIVGTYLEKDEPDLSDSEQSAMLNELFERKKREFRIVREYDQSDAGTAGCSEPKAFVLDLEAGQCKKMLAVTRPPFRLSMEIPKPAPGSQQIRVNSSDRTHRLLTACANDAAEPMSVSFRVCGDSFPYVLRTFVAAEEKASNASPELSYAKYHRRWEGALDSQSEMHPD